MHDWASGVDIEQGATAQVAKTSLKNDQCSYKNTRWDSYVGLGDLEVAIKKFTGSKRVNEVEARKHFEEELKILKRLHDDDCSESEDPFEYIIRPIAFWKGTTEGEYRHPAIVFEKVAIDLHKLLTKANETPAAFPARKRLKVAIEAARGLVHMHGYSIVDDANTDDNGAAGGESKGEDRARVRARSSGGTLEEERYRMLHRDISARNIGIVEPPGSTFPWSSTKVLDLGCSKMNLRRGANVKTYLTTGTDAPGTTGYQAMECFLEKKYTHRSEVFAFGVVLLNLLTTKEAYWKKEDKERSVVLLYKWVHSCEKARRDKHPKESKEMAPTKTDEGHTLKMALVDDWVDLRCWSRKRDLTERIKKLALDCTEQEELSRPEEVRDVLRTLEKIQEDWVATVIQARVRGRQSNAELYERKDKLSKAQSTFNEWREREKSQLGGDIELSEMYQGLLPQHLEDLATKIRNLTKVCVKSAAEVVATIQDGKDKYAQQKAELTELFAVQSHFREWLVEEKQRLSEDTKLGDVQRVNLQFTLGRYQNTEAYFEPRYDNIGELNAERQRYEQKKSEAYNIFQKKEENKRTTEKKKVTLSNQIHFIQETLASDAETGERRQQQRQQREQERLQNQEKCDAPVVDDRDSQGGVFDQTSPSWERGKKPIVKPCFHHLKGNCEHYQRTGESEFILWSIFRSKSSSSCFYVFCLNISYVLTSPASPLRLCLFHYFIVFILL